MCQICPKFPTQFTRKLLTLDENPFVGHLSIEFALVFHAAGHQGRLSTGANTLSNDGYLKDNNFETENAYKKHYQWLLFWS